MQSSRPGVDELRGMFSYDRETGEISPLVGGIFCRRNKESYLTYEIGGRCLFAHTIAWVIVTGEYPPETVDHKDRNGFNNRWSNLRLATQAQQQVNRRLFKNNKSGFRGVYRAGPNRWEAQIRFDKKARSLGMFDSPEDAASAVQRAREARWGEFAKAI